MNFGQQHLNVTQESPSSFVTNWYHHHHLSSILLYMATWLMAPPSLHIRKHGVKRNFSTFFPPTSNNPVITVISVLIALNCVLASPFLFLTALFQALLNWVWTTATGVLLFSFPLCLLLKSKGYLLPLGWGINFLKANKVPDYFSNLTSHQPQSHHVPIMHMPNYG